MDDAYAIQAEWVRMKQAAGDHYRMEDRPNIQGDAAGAVNRHSRLRRAAQSMDFASGCTIPSVPVLFSRE